MSAFANVPNYFLRKCVARRIVGKSNRTVAYCNQCGSAVYIPDGFPERIDDASEAHFFRVIGHLEDCKAVKAAEEVESIAEGN